MDQGSRKQASDGDHQICDHLDQGSGRPNHASSTFLHASHNTMSLCQTIT